MLLPFSVQRGANQGPADSGSSRFSTSDLNSPPDNHHQPLHYRGCLLQSGPVALLLASLLYCHPICRLSRPPLHHRPFGSPPARSLPCAPLDWPPLISAATRLLRPPRRSTAPSVARLRRLLLSRFPVSRSTPARVASRPTRCFHTSWPAPWASSRQPEQRQRCRVCCGSYNDGLFCANCQTSLSTCRPLPMSWPRPRLRLCSVPSPRAKMWAPLLFAPFACRF